MINNYFTLKALVDEIKNDVVGSTIDACYTRIENTLEIILSGHAGQPNVLIVSCKPRANYVYLRSAPRRYAGANVLKDAVGSSVVSFDAVPNERILSLGLTGEKQLVINLFGPHANVFLAESSGSVKDSFLRKGKTDTPLNFAPGTEHTSPGEEQFAERFENAEGSLLHKLASVVPPLAGDPGMEVLYRAGGEELMMTSRKKDVVVPHEVAVPVARAAIEVIGELSRPAPGIYYDNDEPVAMALIEMRHFGGLKKDTYDSVNRCISAFSVNAEKHRTEVSLKSGVLDRLTSRREELERTIGKIEGDTSRNREATYRNFADILMTHLTEVGKGADSFQADGVTIRLDPALTAMQNAQSYYDRAKKARESYRQATIRLEQLRKQLDEVEREIAGVESEPDPGRIASLAKAERTREEARTPFREFETGGYKILVGKDARNNDQLTFGFAKPNDVFLHARGVSGSHVIIRNGSRDYPQKQVIEFAARIAAHYSKARTSSIVPVAYTMRKFVKKAKGQPGAVIMAREEVIFVNPGIPQ